MLTKNTHKFIPKIRNRVLTLVAFAAMGTGTAALTSCGKDDPVEPVKTTITYKYGTHQEFVALAPTIQKDAESGKYSKVTGTAVPLSGGSHYDGTSMKLVLLDVTAVLDLGKKQNDGKQIVYLDGEYKNITNMSQEVEDGFNKLKEMKLINITLTRAQNQK